MDIGAYLSQVAEVGQVDGEGEFTVSHQQAARKLARFSLPRPTAWVAKLVQAAVRWEADSMELFPGIRETRFQLNLDTVPSEEAIISAIVSGGMDGGRPLDALAMALRSAVEQAGHSFLLVVDDGKTKPRPIYAGRYFNKMSEKNRLSRRFCPNPGLHLTVHHGPTRSELAAPDGLVTSLTTPWRILTELRQACFASSVPLVHGRSLEGLLKTPRLGLPRPHRLLLLKGLRELALSPKVLPLPNDFEDRQPSLLASPTWIQHRSEKTQVAQGVLVASADVKGWTEGVTRRRSHLLWLNDGVVVQDETLNSLPTELLNMTVLANASGLATDLTGLALLDNEEYRARRKEVLRAAGAALLDLSVDGRVYEQANDEPTDQDPDRARGHQLRERWRSFSVSCWTVMSAPLLSLPALGESVWQDSRERQLDQDILRKRAQLLSALENDRHLLVEALTGESPPPPERRIEFVFRRG